MTLGTIPRYLVGRRAAILEIASTRWSLAVGLLLVLSASLARNYDGAYLLAEWEVLLHGVAVSIGNAFVLFALVFGAALLRTGSDDAMPRFWTGYFAFLGLFWMTSPMAWLYAIPYERFMTPGEAVQANLWTLALVSLWRVLLMSRVLSVLYRSPIVPMFFLVMVFSDAVFYAAASTMKRPVIDIMGGLQHTETDSILSSAVFSVQVLSVLSALVWLLGALVGLRWLRPRWELPPGTRAGPPRAVLAFGALAVLAWAPALPATQQEQRLRHRAEHMLRSGQVEDAIAEMSRHRRDEYPPIWDPPPRIGYGESTPDLRLVADALEAGGAAPWVLAIFHDKISRTGLQRVPTR